MMTRKQPFTYEEFKSIYSRVPRLCVDLIIKSEQGVLLTLRQKDGWKNQWHLPGGTVLYREKLEDAVNRIAQEELGVDVSIDRELGHTEFHSEVKERGFGYSVTIVFLCHLKTDKFKLDEGAAKFDFFKTLPENTIAEHKTFLENVKM